MPLKLLIARQSTKAEPVQIRARRMTEFCAIPKTLTNPLIFAIAAG